MVGAAIWVAGAGLLEKGGWSGVDGAAIWAAIQVTRVVWLDKGGWSSRPGSHPGLLSKSKVYNL